MPAATGLGLPADAVRRRLGAAGRSGRRAGTCPTTSWARSTPRRAWCSSDHWADMRELGFVSNRTFDVLASGGRLFSDDVPGLRDLLADLGTDAPTWTDPAELALTGPARLARRLARRRRAAPRGRAGRRRALVRRPRPHPPRRRPRNRRCRRDRPRLAAMTDLVLPAIGLPLPPVPLRMGGAHFREDADFVAAAIRDVALLQRHAGLTRESRLLDWGCGAGRLAVGVRQSLGHVRDYHGVDVQPELLELGARQPHRRAHALLPRRPAQRALQPRRRGHLHDPGRAGQRRRALRLLRLLPHARARRPRLRRARSRRSWRRRAAR